MIDTTSRSCGTRPPRRQLPSAGGAPAVLLPVDAPTWHDDDLRRALAHELEHVRRRDWVVQLLARVTCAVYWFHPLAWSALHRLSLEAERACDDAVVAANADGDDYAAQLVSLAERLGPVPLATAVGAARRSDLATRVTALLDPAQPRGRAAAGVHVATSAAVLFALAVVSPLRAVSVTAGPDAPARTPNTDRAARAETAQPGSDDQGRLPSLRDSALSDAAGRGDVAAVVQLMADGADVNAVIIGDGSPLIAAARNGHLRAVRALLDRGANPSLVVPGDGSPLIAAVQADHEDIVTLLVDKGAAIEQTVPGDENALITASRLGALASLRVLVALGADVNVRVLAASPRGDEWRTPLNQARRGGHSAVVALLERAGARE